MLGLRGFWGERASFEKWYRGVSGGLYMFRLAPENLFFILEIILIFPGLTLPHSYDDSIKANKD
jgi:hypothetical protein